LLAGGNRTRIDVSIIKAGNLAAESIALTFDSAPRRGDLNRQHLNAASGESAETAREVATM